VQRETDRITSFWAVLWVDCANVKNAAAGFRKIAKRLKWGLDDDDDEDVIEEVKSLLSNSDKPTLLILDNCDQPQLDYHQLVPPGAHLSIIMTTRLNDFSQYSPDAHMEITGLDLASAMELIFTTSGITKPNEERWNSAAQQIANLLSYHPLAIIIAGSFVRERLCSLAEYPDEFRRQQDEHLRRAPKQIMSIYKSIHNTFEMSARALEESGDQFGREALKLLGALSFMDRTDVCESTFLTAWAYGDEVSFIPQNAAKISSLSLWHGERAKEVFGGSNSRERLASFRRARARLAHLSLISLSADDDTSTTMHPLIHVWASSRLRDNGKMERSWEGALSTLALSTQASKKYEDQTPLIRRHLENSIDTWSDCQVAVKSNLQLCQILFAFAYQLRIVGSLSAVTAAQLLHQELQTLPGWPPDQDEYLEVQLLRTRCFLRVREDEDAEAVINDAMPRLSADHGQRGAFWHELAYIRLNQGRSAEAESILRETVELRKTLADDHPDRLASTHELARAYIDNGRPLEACQILLPLVKTSRILLPPAHPDLLASQHELARARLDSGQPQEAEEELRKIVTIGEAQSPDDHPSLITSQRVLARAMMANGRCVEAEHLLLKVVNICATRFSPSNINRVRSQMVLARACISNKHFRIAQGVLEEVAKVETVLSETERSERKIMMQEISEASHRSCQADV
jgi:tetratricopeptide (TPR) repeat protein